MQLRYESFISLLEDNQFLRKSLNGLRTDMPSRYESLKSFYEEVEAYQMLELMVNQESEMDEKYMIWVKRDCLPHVFEIKSHYSETETFVFSLKTGIPEDVFATTALATN